MLYTEILSAFEESSTVIVLFLAVIRKIQDFTGVSLMVQVLF